MFSRFRVTSLSSQTVMCHKGCHSGQQHETPFLVADIPQLLLMLSALPAKVRYQHGPPAHVTILGNFRSRLPSSHLPGGQLITSAPSTTEGQHNGWPHEADTRHGQIHTHALSTQLPLASGTLYGIFHWGIPRNIILTKEFTSYLLLVPPTLSTQSFHKGKSHSSIHVEAETAFWPLESPVTTE